MNFYNGLIREERRLLFNLPSLIALGTLGFGRQLVKAISCLLPTHSWKINGECISTENISNFYGFSYVYTVAFRNPITEGIAECIPKLIEKYFQFSLTKKYIAFKIDLATYENRRH